MANLITEVCEGAVRGSPTQVQSLKTMQDQTSVPKASGAMIVKGLFLM